MYKIYPSVKTQVASAPAEQKCVIENISVSFAKGAEKACYQLKSFLNFTKVKENASIKFEANPDLKEEAYVIDINPDNTIIVKANGYSGFYYSVKTLKQIFRSENKISSLTLDCVHIEDEPSLKIRGFMLDISRNKVPTIKTIKYIIDIMSDLKMNHFELYVEGFSFEYKSFPQYLKENAYITVEEYLELQAYCNKNAIDMVGNENGFGHMADWLAKPELVHLSEKEDGIFLWGRHRGPSTLDPNSEEAFELVKTMYKDMIPLSNSKYFNMNFDEPFELGMGKSKEECEKTSVDAVYKKFAKKCADEISTYGKDPMIWGDVLVRHHSTLDDLPSNMIYLDWGYDAEAQFDVQLKRLKDMNTKFVSAPGTSTWCGWYGRTFDWYENISQAIWSNFKLDGEGVILTDWGDYGHFQHLPSTLGPLAFTGLLSWRCSAGTNKKTRDFLNKFVYHDNDNVVADVIMDAGNYYMYEKNWRGNGTLAFSTLMFATFAFTENGEKTPSQYFNDVMKWSKLEKNNYFLVTNFLKNKVKEFKTVIKDKLIKKEMINTADLIYALTDLNYAFNENLKNDEKVKLLAEANKILEKYKVDLKDIWLTRNKYSLLDDSIELIDRVMKFINVSIEYFEGGANEA